MGSKLSTKKKYQMYEVTNANGDYQQVLPETSAEQVTVEKINGQETAYKNVQEAIADIYEKASSSGVIGVKGSAEDTYRKGLVNLSAENVGAQPVFTDGDATIASKSGNIVTIKAGVKQSGGTISNSTGADIALKEVAMTGSYNDLSNKPTLGSAAAKSAVTSIGAVGSDDNIPTEKAVRSAISSLPTPMQFKGSVGESGTITWANLPAAASSNNGHVYKVITEHTTAPVAKVGDTIVSNGSEWIIIPSGDEPSGTVTSVGISVPAGLTASGTPITSSGTIAINYANGYTIPTISKQNSWDLKQDALSAAQLSAVNSGITSEKVSTYDGYATGKQNANSKLSNIAGLTDTNKFLKIDSSGAIVAADVPSGSISVTGGDFTLSGSTGAPITNATLAKVNSLVTSKVYSAVTVDQKGRVTDAGTMIEFGASASAKPSDDLQVGGLFFLPTT